MRCVSTVGARRVDAWPPPIALMSQCARERALKETLSHFLLVPLGQWEYGNSENTLFS